MAKISLLTLADNFDGNEQLPILQGGRTKRLTLRLLASAITPLLMAWYKGDKGDPGADTGAVGSFAAIAGMTIRNGTTRVLLDDGGWLVADPALTADAMTAHPLAITKTANGRFFRRDPNRPLSITHFGAVPGARTKTGDLVPAASDAYPAIIAALRYARFCSTRSQYSEGGCVIEVPSGSFNVNQTVNIDQNITFRGNSTGLEGGNNSELIWPANLHGFVFHHYPSSSQPGVYSASGSIIQGLTFTARTNGAYLASQACGVWARTRIQVYNCFAEGFAMDGFSFRASSDGNTDPLGNGNLCILEDSSAYGNGRAGAYWSGYDASAGSQINFNSVNNGAWGWYVDCFLPMRVEGGHASNNGGFTSGLYPTTTTVFNKGKTYYAVVPSDPALFGYAQASAYPNVEPGTDTSVWRELPGGSSVTYPDAPQWVKGGSYICGGQGFLSRGSSHDVPYTEGGGAPYWVHSPSFTIGGIHGAGKDGGGRALRVNLGLWSADGGQEWVGRSLSPARTLTVSVVPDPKAGFIREVRDTDDPNTASPQQWQEFIMSGYWAFGYSQRPYTLVSRPGTSNAGYMGLNDNKQGVVTNLSFSLGDENGSFARLVYMASAQPGTSVFRARGQTYINSAPVRGGPAGWTVVADGTPGTLAPTGIVGAVQATGLTASSSAADIVAALKTAGLAA